METTQREISKGFFAIFISNLGRYITYLIFIPILVRLIGSEGYGNYAFFKSMFYFTMLLMNFGLFDSTRRYISMKPRDKKRIEELSMASIFLSIIIGGIWIIFYYFLFTLTSFRNIFKVDIPYFFEILLITLVAAQLYEVFRGILLGLHKEERAEPLRFLVVVIFAIVGTIMMFIGYGISGMLLSYAIGWITIAALSCVYTRKLIDFSYERLISGIKKYSQNLISFGFLSMLVSLLNLSLFKVDVITIKYFLQSAEVGYYNAALQTAEFVYLIPMSIQIVMLHGTSALWCEGVEKISKITSRIMKYTILSTLILLIGIFVLGKSFLSIYFGREFICSNISLLILLPGVLGFSMARVIWPVVQSKGELKLVLIPTVIASILNIFLNIILIPRIGIAGAAIATSISYSTMFFLHSYVARMIGVNPFKNIKFYNILAVSFITLMLLFFFSHLIKNDILNLLLMPILGLCIYIKLAFFFKIIDQSEIEDLISYFPVPIRKISQYALSKLYILLGLKF